jgi:membrane protein YdbS with pleckstrin-like domain
MRTPVRAVPQKVERAANRARWLRWLDALVTWLVAWGVVALMWETATSSASAIVALLLVALAAFIGPARRRWRPVSAIASLSVSRRLKPGDHAWLVLPERVQPVIVTARRRLRLVVASPDQGTEGLEIRRTRVLVVPA